MSKTKWSVSRLSNYANCGMAYRLDKIDKVPQRQAGWFIQGTAVHAAIEGYERSGRSMYVDEAANLFYWYWDNELEQAREKQPSDSMWIKGGRGSVQNDLERRHALGQQQVRDYINANPVDGLWAPFELIPGEYSVEVGFDTEFDDIRVIGYIDAIKENRQTGEWRVEDWKTGTKVPSDPFQMKTYDRAINNVFGVKVSEGGWWMCKDNEFVSFDLSKFTYEDVAGWYEQLVRGVENGVFLPNPKDCFTCVSKPYCPYGSKNPLPWPPIGPDFS